MVDIASLSVAVTGDISDLQAKLGQANREVQGFGSQLSGAGAVITTAFAAAGAGIAAGLAVGVKAAGDLQQSVANISTIKPDIDTSGVFGALNEMSTRIPSTAAELGESLYNVFSSLDVGQEQALQLVETFAKGAAGAGTSAEKFGTAAMGVMNAYGLTTKDAAAVSDMFFDTINKGVITGDELAASLGPVTQAAKAAGVEWKDLGPMIAAVTKEGGPAAQNVNNLNNLFQKFTTSAAQLAMNKMGIATVDATGAFRKMPDVMTELKAHLATLTQAEAAAALQEIFPDAQARQGAQTIMSQIDFVNEALKSNQEASGSTAAAYEKMSATFNSQSKLLINNLMAIGTAIGAELLPHITPLITALSKSLPAAFQDVKDSVATVKQVLAGEWAPDDSIRPFTLAVGNAAVVLRDTFGPAVTAVAAFVTGTLIPAFEQVSTFVTGTLAPAFQSTLEFLRQHPAIIAGVVAAFATFQVIVTVAGWITGLIAAWGAMSTAITAAGGVIAAIVAVLGGPLTVAILAISAAVGILTVAWIEDWGGMRQIVSDAWAAIEPTFTALVDWLGVQIPKVLGFLTTVAWPALVVAGQAVSDWIMTVAIPAFTALVDWLGPKVSAVVTWITDTGWPGLVTAATAVSDWITTVAVPAFTALVDWLGPKISAVTTWIYETGWPALVTAGQAVGVMVAAVIKFFQDLYAELDKRGVFTELEGIWKTLTDTGNKVWEMVQTAVGWWLKLQEALLPVKESVGALTAAAMLPALAAHMDQVGQKTQVAIDPIKLLGFGLQFAVEQVVKGLKPLQDFVAAMDALSKIKLPTFSLPGFGGGGGAQQLSWTGNGSWQATTSGGFANNDERLAFVRMTAGEFGHDPETAARVAMSEGAGPAGPVGDSGRSFGALQAYTGGGQGNAFMQQTGLDPSDPNNEKALVRWQIANLSQSGWQPFHGAQAIGVGNFQGINVGPPKPALRDMQRIPLGPTSGAPGMDPSQWPGFMSQVNEQLPDYLMSLDTIQQAGSLAFIGTAAVAKEQGLVLSGSQTDAMGNVMSVYSTASGDIIRTTTDASGKVTSQYATMASGATLEMGNLAAGVTTTQTTLGANLLTTVTDTAGTYVTTVTDMSGQIVAQFAGLAGQTIASTAAQNTGVLTSYNMMGTGVTQTVTDMGGQIITKLTETSGLSTTTVTDMSGQILSQMTTLKDGTVVQMDDMGVKTTTAFDTMHQTTTTTVTTMSGEVITTVTDMNGQVVAQSIDTRTKVTQEWVTTSASVKQTAADMGLQVIGESRKMGDGLVTATKTSTGEMVSIITNAAGQVIGQFKNIVEGGKTVATGLDTAAKGLKTYADGLKGVGSAAAKAADQLAEFNKQAGGGSAKEFAKGTGSSGGFGKASGGPVFPGREYLVGEQGPEWFMPSQSGTIVPHALSSGGGGTETVVFVIQQPDGRTVEEWYVTGKELATRRGRT